jgi:pyrimidine operon attenuation protein/uracil phosphoribosyltransferase
MSQKYCLLLKVNIILHRLACQLIEKHLDFKDTILGIQPRGTFLAERLKSYWKNIILLKSNWVI